jgi:hypothetical protein
MSPRFLDDVFDYHEPLERFPLIDHYYHLSLLRLELGQ